MSDPEWELECLRKAIARHRQWAIELKLTRGQSRMLALLYKREVCSHEALQMMTDHGVDNSTNANPVYVHRINKKLKSTGARIVAVWGVGYRLEGRDKLKKHIIHI